MKISEIRAASGLPAEFKAWNDGYGYLQGDKQQAFLDQAGALVPRAGHCGVRSTTSTTSPSASAGSMSVSALDFDHGAGIAGFDSEADAPNVTAELVRRGYPQEQIAGNLGRQFPARLESSQGHPQAQLAAAATDMVTGQAMCLLRARSRHLKQESTRNPFGQTRRRAVVTAR